MALYSSLDLLILETMGKQSRWQRKLRLEVIEVQKGQQSLLGSLGSRQGCEAIRWRRSTRMKERAGQLGVGGHTSERADSLGVTSP